MMMPLWLSVPLLVVGGVVITGVLAFLIDRSNHA
jgi:hypothetical protein